METNKPKKDIVYLDCAASTPMHRDVISAMLPYFDEHYGNASSVTHPAGLRAKAAVNKARNIFAKHLGVDESEIIFNSGASEGNNIAIKGVFDKYKGIGRHIISAKTEHKSVLACIDYLIEFHDAEVTWLNVNKSGEIDYQELKTALRSDTIITCLMAVNNETGVITDIKKVSETLEGSKCIFICDATQALGKIDLKTLSENTAISTFSSHKINGPKGTGAMYISRKNPRVALSTFIHGGDHEKGLRSGTLNTPNIVGFAKALELHYENLENRNKEFTAWNQLLVDFFLSKGAKINGGSNRVPHILNVQFEEKKADKLIKANPDFYFSLGSACSESMENKSHVLNAMGFNADEVKGSIRLSFGMHNTSTDIEKVRNHFDCLDSNT